MAQDIRKTDPQAPARYVEPFSALRSEMDRLFDSFLGNGFGRMPDLARASFGGMSPSMDVRETPTEIVVEAELPGIDEKDVSLTIDNGILTVKGEKKSEREEKKDAYHMMERSYGSFQRSLRLGDLVDADKATANFDKGVLTVKLPKRAEAAARQKQIPIGKA